MLKEIKLKDKAISRMRAHACYKVLLSDTGWRNKDLDLELEMHGSSLQYKWDKSLVMPSFLWISKFANKCKVVETIYSLPLWELLADRPISRRKLQALTTTFRSGHPFLPYNFPNHKYLTRKEREPLPTVRSENSQRLVERGDVYGFMAIVALVREEEMKQDPYSACVHIANLIRALPAVGRTLLFKEQFGLLCSAVVRLKNRSARPTELFRVHWKIVRAQASDPNFEPCPEFQEKNSSTRRLIGAADPIVFLSDMSAMVEREDPLFEDRPTHYKKLATGTDVMFNRIQEVVRYKEIVRDWEVDAHLQASLLGPSPTQTWSYLYSEQLAKHSKGKVRMWHIFQIRRCLNRAGLDCAAQRQYIRLPRVRLSGQSVMEAICHGNHSNAVETVRIDWKHLQ